jgi:alcohol dehydrogenase class IV
MELLDNNRNNFVFYGLEIEKDFKEIFEFCKIKDVEIILVTGLESFDKSDYKNIFKKACDDFGITVYHRIKIAPNPCQYFAEKELENQKGTIHWIFCIGGGSVIDFGKLLKLNKYKEAKIFVLYTLPGSGSIVTPFAIYNNQEFKVGDHSEEFIPNVVYINEKIINNLSYYLKLSAVCDIFAHAFESLLSNMSNKESRFFSQTSLKILFRSGVNIKKIQPRDLIIADINAAKAESKAMVLFPHAIGHYLTYKFNIAHPIASNFYCKRYVRLLNSKGFKVEDKYVKYLDDIEKLLKKHGAYPNVESMDAKEAIDLIQKYMSFVFENAPIKISLNEYVNLINS